MTFNHSTCELLELGIGAAKEAIPAVQTRVIQMAEPVRAFDIQIVKKAIEECEAVVCLLRSDLRTPATAHIRTLTNTCATVLQLNSDGPAKNYTRFFASAVFESMRIFAASLQTGYPLTFITRDAGWDSFKEELKREHNHDFKRRDSWVEDSSWQSTILLQDEWLSLAYQFVQWYDKFQHATPLGLSMEGAAQLIVLVPAQHSAFNKQALDRSIRISDYLTRPEVTGWLAHGLLRRIIETTMDGKPSPASLQMEETELKLIEAVKGITPKTINDLVVFPFHE